MCICWGDVCTWVQHPRRWEQGIRVPAAATPRARELPGLETELWIIERAWAFLNFLLPSYCFSVITTLTGMWWSVYVRVSVCLCVQPRVSVPTLRQGLLSTPVWARPAASAIVCLTSCWGNVGITDVHIAWLMCRQTKFPVCVRHLSGSATSLAPWCNFIFHLPDG